jgi:hypothetical protein
VSFGSDDGRIKVQILQRRSTMRRKLAVLLLFLSLTQVIFCQATPTAVTNSDLIKMVAAGIGDQTIILAIERGPTMLDTSAQALILLKSAGVSEQALNAILAATKSPSQPHAQPSQSASTSSPVTQDLEQKEHHRYRPPANPRSGSRWHLW